MKTNYKAGREKWKPEIATNGRDEGNRRWGAQTTRQLLDKPIVRVYCFHLSFATYWITYTNIFYCYFIIFLNLLHLDLKFIF